jgi:cytochrome c biogenesis protein CcmG/thiol:disulfide interchange protein DsbE
MMKKKFWLISVVSIFLIAVGLLGCEPGMMTGATKSSNIAPDFTLNDLDGKPFRFSSTRGKVVILDFWATWCPPCRMEIPHFVDLYRDYRGKGLEIVGVSLDRGGASAVKPFARTNGINYPVLIGNQKVTSDYGGVRSIPTTFVIDRKARIVEKYVGYRDKAVFEEVIKKLL